MLGTENCYIVEVLVVVDLVIFMCVS